MFDASLPPGQGGPDVLLVLRAGDALPEVAAVHGEFADWIERAVGAVWEGGWLVHDLRSSDRLPDPESVAGIIITGSVCSVTERATWMLRAEAYIRDVIASECPLLGICFGHQLMAQALGGNVQKNPRGREIGTVELTRIDADPLFDGLPPTMAINATHVDSAIALPRDAKVIATTALEAHAAVAFGPVARGVQFHPEIDGAVMQGYIRVRWPNIVDEGLNAEAILEKATDTPESCELLRNFIRSFVLSPARRAA
jgi:GMP synthase (glutamine-hydrolysing)